MFFRGQQIRILDSTLYKKRHPKAGDEGFIREVFFFPTERLLVVEMVMFKTTKGFCKPVRKRFVVNLSMSPRVLDSTLKVGLASVITLNTPYVNILSTYVSRNHTIPASNTLWLFTGRTNPKVPVCSFELVPDIKPIDVNNENEFEAWISAMNTIVFELHSINDIYVGNSPDTLGCLFLLKKYMILRNSRRLKQQSTHFRCVLQPKLVHRYRHNRDEHGNRECFIEKVISPQDVIIALKLFDTTISNNVLHSLVRNIEDLRKVHLSPSNIRQWLSMGSSYITNLTIRNVSPEVLQLMSNLNVLAIYTLFKRMDHSKAIGYIKMASKISNSEVENKINEIHLLATHNSAALSRFYELSFPNIN